MTHHVSYLDHAATTPILEDVAEAMAPFGSEVFGNASGGHRVARRARLALDDAREQISTCLGAAPSDIVFTSGGTEADNLAIFGVLEALRLNHRISPTSSSVGLLCSAVEHPAVYECARALSARGVGYFEAPVDENCVVRKDAFIELISKNTTIALVSVMTANNEVGTIQPIRELVDAVRTYAPGSLFHTDAVQAAPWLDLNICELGVDLMSVSAHKLGGPKGTGVLVVPKSVPLAPLFHGGGQEHERRSGTHNVAGAVGMATALVLARKKREQASVRVQALRNRLFEGLVDLIPDVIPSVAGAEILPGHCHVQFLGIEQEELLVLLDKDGICASGGSSCASGALKPSRVLLAMGYEPARARSALRFTLGHGSSESDVDHALEIVPQAVARLRR